MRQREFTNCASCSKGVAHAGDLPFVRLRVDYMLLDPGAVRRQAGLEMQMGAAAPLAQVLGPDEDLAQQVSTKTVLLCLQCALEPFPVMVALEEDDRD